MPRRSRPSAGYEDSMSDVTEMAVLHTKTTPHYWVVRVHGFLARLTREYPPFSSPALYNTAKILVEGSADLAGKYFSIDTRHDILGATTCCLALLKIDADGGRAVFNIRQPIGITLRHYYLYIECNFGRWMCKYRNGSGKCKSIARAIHCWNRCDLSTRYRWNC